MENPKKELSGRLDEFRIALEEEIKELRKNSSASAVALNNGVKIRTLGGEYTYRFRVDTSINMPSDSPATLVIKKKRFDAVIVSFDEPNIIITTFKDLGDYIGFGRLESDLSMLMEKLIKRIEDNSEVDNVLGEKMLDVDKFLGESGKLLTVPPQNFSESQAEAVRSAIGRDVTYIWGPPGTGKTTTIQYKGYNLFQITNFT